MIDQTQPVCSPNSTGSMESKDSNNAWSSSSNKRRLRAELDAGAIYQAARHLSALMDKIDGEEDRRRSLRMVNRIRNNQRRQSWAQRSQNKEIREELDVINHDR